MKMHDAYDILTLLSPQDIFLIMNTNLRTKAYIVLTLPEFIFFVSSDSIIPSAQFFKQHCIA